MAFIVVPFVSAVILLIDRTGVDWWTLSPGQLWGIVQAAFWSVIVGVVGRYAQATAAKTGGGSAGAGDEPAGGAAGDVPEGLV